MGDVLALGAAAVTASGAVWYLPALCVLRSGADRPVSARLAAGGCVLGWGTGAVLAALLFLGAARSLVGWAAGAGAAACALLHLVAAVARRRERQEAGVWWAALGARAVGGVRSPERAFLGSLLTGLLVAAVVAGMLLSQGEPSVGQVVAAGVVAGAVVLGFLSLAMARAHHVRRT
ncbi:hypothetical protein [Streptomyces sulphureus]|uniref:hypothetical protein n=1 Tax=Streptomyces sulphureus TaxID=47758 RepID=UPI00037834D1|nr:hypothetical protein [Streptomyces sulphureus]